MRTLGALLVLVGLLGAGCARPVAPEPFAEFSVSRSGGVAGLRDVLRVRPDGVAVVTSPDPRAGRLSADRIAHARRVLESDELRREVAASRRDQGSPRCSDLISRGFTMGSLSMAVTEPCGDERAEPTPAFDELLEVVGDATRGTFDAPLAADEVPSVTVRVQRPATAPDPASTIVVEPGGKATLTTPGRTVRRADLGDRWPALALVAGGLLGTAPTPCAGGASPGVAVVADDGRRVSRSPCGFGPRGVDAYALVGTLGRAFPG